MRQTIPGVWQVSSAAPQPHVSRPETLQIPPTWPIDGRADAGQPSMQVPPEAQALPGTQLAKGAASDASWPIEPPAASEPFLSVPASGRRRQLQVFGTFS